MLRRAQNANPGVAGRLVSVAPGLIAATAVAALVVVVVAGCGAAKTTFPGDAKRADEASVIRRCPLEAPRSLVSQRPGSSRMLVPGRPTAVLLCRYEGFQEPGMRAPGFGLLGERRLGTVAGRSVARALDALRPGSGGAMSCPDDNASSALALFRYPSGLADPLTFDLSGCASVTNGRLSRALQSASVLEQLTSSTRSTPALLRASEATIEGSVRACGGAAVASRCRPAGKSFHLVVRVFGPNGDWTDLAGIGRSARFRMLVVPGRSRVELIQDWWDGHPRILATRLVDVRAGRVDRVRFTLGLK